MKCLYKCGNKPHCSKKNGRIQAFAYKKIGRTAMVRPKMPGSYSASVTEPHRLGLLLIFRVPVQAIWGIYSVPGQG